MGSKGADSKNQSGGGNRKHVAADPWKQHGSQRCYAIGSQKNFLWMPAVREFAAEHRAEDTADHHHGEHQTYCGRFHAQIVTEIKRKKSGYNAVAGTAGGNHRCQENPAQVHIANGKLAVLPEGVRGVTFRLVGRSRIVQESAHRETDDDRWNGE